MIPRVHNKYYYEFLMILIATETVALCHSVQALLLKVNAYEERIQDYNYCQCIRLLVYIVPSKTQ